MIGSRFCRLITRVMMKILTVPAVWFILQGTIDRVFEELQTEATKPWRSFRDERRERRPADHS